MMVLDRTWMVMAMMLWIWLVPLLLIVWMMTATFSDKSPSGYGPAQPVVAGDPALQFVRERYARGEIGRAEYEHLVAELLGRS